MLMVFVAIEGRRSNDVYFTLRAQALSRGEWARLAPYLYFTDHKEPELANAV
jgi:hypothetical protein